MKQTALFILFILLNSVLLNAQSIELWGTTLEGGGTNTGSVFKYSVSGDSIISTPLIRPTASNPLYNGFIEATNGKLYGVSTNSASVSGINGASYQTMGCLIEFDPIQNAYKEIYTFFWQNQDNGLEPSGSLFQASNGKLYGMTKKGGANNEGVIFEIDPTNYSFSKLYDFTVTTGKFPEGSLIEGIDGNLYGCTRNGGDFSRGVFFRFKLSNLTYTKLVDFQTALGSFPFNNLVKVDNSTLIGSTTNGGINSQGTLYSFDFMNNQFSLIYNFGNHTEIWGSISSIAFDGFNKIYGTSSPLDTLLPSKLFCYNISSDTLEVLHQFDPNIDGHQPIGGVIYNNGFLYGLCQKGGPDNQGTLYNFNLSTSAFSVLEAFTTSENVVNQCTTTPFIASNGRMYGLGSKGGESDDGGVFSFDLGNNDFNKILDFNYGLNGMWPNCTLFQASNGRVFGTSYRGGQTDNGVVFEVDRFTNEIEPLYNGDNITGKNYTDIMIEYQGNLLGTGENGSIYSFDMNSNVYSELSDISGTTASGGLTQIEDYAYGVSYSGGVNDLGTLYRFDLNNNNISNIEYSFDGMLSGSSPVGHLTATEDFYLYGMSESGGINGYGTIYKYEPFLNVFTKLYDFDNLSGNSPSGSLVKHSNGKFYGLTKYGGNNDLGVLFSFDDNTQTYEKLVDFDSLNGSIPRGSLIVASNGLLYGLTSEGGDSNDGVLFSFNTSTNQINTLFDFDKYVSGSHPYHALTEIDPILSTVDKLEKPLVVYPNPFQSVINLQNPKSEVISIRVFDLYGSLLLENTSNEASISIDLTGFSSGVYTLQYDLTGFTGSTKIIKY
ncbi:MAG: choice-of-anchor tandem repeat GloVer-containing protein [Bacteroidota bacterium]